jgi:hypothetical protein
VTIAVHTVAATAAARHPAAARADAPTKSGTSKTATHTGSSPPKVVSRTTGRVNTAIHQAAPARACAPKYARPHLTAAR